MACSTRQRDRNNNQLLETEPPEKEEDALVEQLDFECQDIKMSWSSSEFNYPAYYYGGCRLKLNVH